MAKKLTEEKIQELLDAGIREFTDKGYEGANTNAIAKKAGISIGVLYKYYGNKETFFLACLKKSTKALETTYEQLENLEGGVFDKAEFLLRRAICSSREHRDYIRMYHTLSSSSNPVLAKMLAEEIEKLSSRMYTEHISEAQREGSVRGDIAPELAAFFVDNLLTMLRFSYSCTYYKERYRMYLIQGEMGEKEPEDIEEVIIGQMMLLLRRAFEAKP